MKDLMLIDNRLLNRFSAKVMKIANYLPNRLPNRNRTHGERIPKQAWIERKQDLYHVCIFGNLAFYNIPVKKM